LLKVALSTLGCKVNQYESAGILEALDKTIFSTVPFNAKADLYIINTCTVTKKTDYQSRQLIRRTIKNNPEALIIVTGCYAQVASDDIARIPGVTLIAGTAEKKNIPALIRDIAKDNPQVLVGDIGHAREFSGLFPERFPGHTRAFLKIQDGCNSYCSYCIVPFTRGRSRSLPEKEVTSRLEILAREHYKEIVLTGIHLGMYGRDLLPPSNLFNIMAMVETKGVVKRLRLSSIEITEISDDIISLMANSRTLCHHLHIPLQSGDDKILFAMKRHYTSDFFKNRLYKIHETIPDIAIGLDVMTGFPGEDEESFRKTLKFIEELPVAYLHVFPYSERPGTAASSFPDKVEEDRKKERARILREIGGNKRGAFADRFRGKQLSVLVEDEKDRVTGLMKGYSGNYIPVLIADENDHRSPQIISVIAEHTSQDGKIFARRVNHD